MPWDIVCFGEDGFKAEVHSGNLLDRVEQGEEILITRYDKSVGAGIVPEGYRNTRQIEAAVDGLMALQRRIAARADKRASLTDTEVRDAIEAGRA